MPIRWLVKFTVEGDLRFVSHHDMMRAAHRLALRANLPLRFSQGFNPRPQLSLPVPRPVGVASRDDWLVFALEDPAGPIAPEDLRARLQRQAPPGMRFLAARRLQPGPMPQPARVDYELPLTAREAEDLPPRLASLAESPTWQIERPAKPGRRGRARKTPPKPQTIDLRPRVAELQQVGRTLRLALQPDCDAWAKPAEVLALLGLVDPGCLARLVRTNIQTAA